jgi:hypothetical protein
MRRIIGVIAFAIGLYFLVLSYAWFADAAAIIRTLPDPATQSEQYPYRILTHASLVLVFGLCGLFGGVGLFRRWRYSRALTSLMFVSAAVFILAPTAINFSNLASTLLASMLCMLPVIYLFHDFLFSGIVPDAQEVSSRR